MKIDNKGFSLIEVMVAFLCFSAFYLVFNASQSKSLRDSYYVERELTLNFLAELILNEIMLNPPIFREALVVTKEKKNFTEDQWKDYEYTIEYRRFEIPNLFNLTQGIGGQEGDEGQPAATQSQANQNNPFAAFQGVFDQITLGIQEKIWQIQVTVRDKNTDLSWSVSTWLKNEEYKLDVAKIIQAAGGGARGSGAQGGSPSGTTGGNQ